MYMIVTRKSPLVIQRDFSFMANSNYQKGQFLVVPNKAIVLKLRGAALNVYLAVVDHADESGQCFPSYGRLANVTGYSKRVCMRAVDELETIGLLKKATRKLPIRGNTSNIYQLKVIHTPSVVDVTGGSDAHVTPSSVVDVTPKLYPNNPTQFNSKGLSFEKRKAWAKACEADRALERKEASRAAPSNKGSFGSLGDIVNGRSYVQTSG